jgi:hypothetical protein
MDCSYSKIFSPHFNRSTDLKRLKGTSLQKPVKIEEIKSILEDSITKKYLKIQTFKNSPNSTKPALTQFKPCETKTISTKHNHLYPSFMKTSTNVPFIYKGLKSHNLSPLLRIHSKKFRRKNKKSSNSIDARKTESPLEVSYRFNQVFSLALNQDSSRSSKSSSSEDSIGFYKTRYS